MSEDLLTRLAAAHTEEERSWIVTESLLNTLSPELSSAVWAVAVPHWFNAEILAALRPELAEQASQLYTQLQTVSFVEVFPERGHNIHERTRALILQRLWQQDRDEFEQISARAASYFAQQNTPHAEIESLYHQIVNRSEASEIADTLWSFTVNLNNAFRFAELDALAETLLEQVLEERANKPSSALVYECKGDAERRTYNKATALENYHSALGLYRQVGARLGEANTLKAIGDVLQFLKQSTEALSHYNEALEIYRQVGDRLGEANTLQAIGDVLQFLDQRTEALSHYNEALEIYRQVGDRLGEANTLGGQGRIYQALGQIEQAIENHQQALSLHQSTGARAGQGSALCQLGRSYEALEDYSTAANYYQQSLAIYQQIGDRYSQGVLWRDLGDVWAKLNQITDARSAYSQARAFYQDIGLDSLAQKCQEALETLDEETNLN